MESIVKFNLMEEVDTLLKKRNPELFSELESYFKEVAETGRYYKNRNSLGFTIAHGILIKYVNELTSTEKKIAYLLNDKFVYSLVENGYLEEIFVAIQLMKREQAIYIKYFPTFEEPKNNIQCLEKFEKIVLDTYENGLNYYNGLVEAKNSINI